MAALECRKSEDVSDLRGEVRVGGIPQANDSGKAARKFGMSGVGLGFVEDGEDDALDVSANSELEEDEYLFVGIANEGEVFEQLLVMWLDRIPVKSRVDGWYERSQQNALALQRLGMDGEGEVEIVRLWSV